MLCHQPHPASPDLSGTSSPFPERASVAELFAERRQAAPGAIALRDETGALTYAELEALAAGAAEALEAAGGGGGFIGLAAERSRGYVAAVLGIAMAGGAYLPIDESEPPGRQQSRREACHAVLRWEEEAGGGLRWSAERRRPAPEPTEADPGVSPAYVLFTSGSTGTPKGVIIPHRAIARLVCGTDYLQLGPGDVVAFHSHPGFDASTLEIWGPLLNGGTVVITPTEKVLAAAELRAHLRRFGITTLWLTTSLLSQLVQEDPTLFAGLRHLLFGGEAADPAALRRICAHGRPARLINGYGPTECTTFAVCHVLSGEVPEPFPIGRPIANTTALILAETGEPAEEGELFLGGPGLALGYLDQPELTAERFPQTRWGRLYRTGDRVRRRPDGLLDYLGRLDRQVKIRGFRIEPGEIEAALRLIPGVTRVAVRPRPRPSGEAALVAYYTGPATPEAVRTAAAATLPAQMVPSALVPVEAFPLTPNGKLDERALPPPWRETGEEGEGIATLPLPAALAAAWREVLGVETVHPHQNFFELGGTSLSLLRVYRRLRERPDCATLRVVHLFQYPTLQALEQFLRQPSPAWSPEAAKNRAEKARARVARSRLRSEA